jgi:hypothetical protein
MRSHKLYKHLISSNGFNIATKIKDFRKPKNDNKNRKNKN